ncbi:MAG TPA: SurA N-terminal domain-containing protein [Candidatus Eisenbacteria bacterium]|nr:SurA N-terminal domain-containing protein [Candidatus Eisenbacteria bacterium]
MMQGLRDNMKLIIWITAVVFLVGFGILELGGVMDFRGAGRSSAGPAGVIAEVNGQAVRYDAFQQTYNQRIAELQQTRQLAEGEDAYVREQVWQELVRNALLEQEAKRRGISASPDEIKSAIRYSPPQFIVQSQVFNTNGQFDYRKYLAELDNPNSQVPWAQVEAVVASQLPLQKLQEQVIAGAKVSDGDIRDRYLLQNERLNLQFVRFAPDSFPIDTTKVGGADVESYYKAHPEEFTGPEEAKVQVALVPRVPDESDFSAARERLRPVLDELKASPDSFEARARIYSEIGSATRGGGIPAPTPFDDLRPIFRTGLANVRPGQVSDILQEERSLHIFRVDSREMDPVRKKEMILYHEIAVRVMPGPNAVRAALDKAKAFVKEAEKGDLPGAATKYGYRTLESAYFAPGKSQNEVFQRFPDLETWVFTGKMRSISRPIPSETGWYVYQILDRRKAGVRPLEQVAADVKKAVIRSLQMQRATAAAEQARAALLAGGKEDAVAAQFNGTVGNAGGVTRNGFIGPLQQDPKMVGQLMTMQAGSWTPVLTGRPGAVIFKITGHDVPNEEEFQKSVAQIRENLLQERRQVLFIEWMDKLRRSAKVKDYRENYFDI